MEKDNMLNDFSLITERLENGFIAYMIIEDKMNAPFFLPGDKIAIKKKDYYDAKDMILYKIENHYFVRRIIKKVDKAYFICGDKENEIRFIEESFVLGKVISKERGVKRYSLLINNKNLSLSLVMLKGKRLLNRSTVFDEQELVNNSFEMAVNSTEINDDKLNKYKNTKDIPLDPRLEKELECFKSPAKKVEEYEEKNSKDNLVTTTR